MAEENIQKYLMTCTVHFTFHVNCNHNTELFFFFFSCVGVPVNSNDRSKEPRTSWNHICKYELKSCVVGLCQDVQGFSLASQFLEKIVQFVFWHTHLSTHL